ncbi:hypothetical protein HPB51_024206 [Rhipicephalus microplus]|uniref:Uncharacterized protein n=1 Tax=Rhipicephalus microplus TaxID=6941 RepID=A0A9J6DWR8_RHIMP|nr:hypothetical protein HPB51_024206 [Rhipicephalus microplus]
MAATRSTGVGHATRLHRRPQRSVRRSPPRDTRAALLLQGRCAARRLGSADAGSRSPPAKATRAVVSCRCEHASAAGRKRAHARKGATVREPNTCSLGVLCLQSHRTCWREAHVRKEEMGSEISRTSRTSLYGLLITERLLIRSASERMFPKGRRGASAPVKRDGDGTIHTCVAALSGLAEKSKRQSLCNALDELENEPVSEERLLRCQQDFMSQKKAVKALLRFLRSTGLSKRL